MPLRVWIYFIGDKRRRVSKSMQHLHLTAIWTKNIKKVSRVLLVTSHPSLRCPYQPTTLSHPPLSQQDKVNVLDVDDNCQSWWRFPSVAGVCCPVILAIRWHLSNVFSCCSCSSSHCRRWYLEIGLWPIDL